jgi:hypothetical protein
LNALSLFGCAAAVDIDSAEGEAAEVDSNAEAITFAPVTDIQFPGSAWYSDAQLLPSYSDLRLTGSMRLVDRGRAAQIYVVNLGNAAARGSGRSRLNGVVLNSTWSVRRAIGRGWSRAPPATSSST